MRKYVVGFLFSPDKNNIVLIEKKRPAWQKGFYNGIGGHCLPNEDPLDAIVREFEEETGLGTNYQDWNLIAIGTEIVSGDEIHFFSGSNEGYEFVETTTDELIVRLTVNQILNRNNIENKYLIKNLNWLIPLALDEQNCVTKFNFILNQKCNSNE